MGEVAKAAQAMVEQSTRMYPDRSEHVAMRCALGDAAHLCDAMMRQIESEWRGRGGIIKKRGQEIAAVAKLCGDAIWAMRELIAVTNPAPPPQGDG